MISRLQTTSHSLLNSKSSKNPSIEGFLELLAPTLCDQIIILDANSDTFIWKIESWFNREDHPRCKSNIRISNIMGIETEKMSDRMRKIRIREGRIFLNFKKTKLLTLMIHIFLHSDIPRFSCHSRFQSFCCKHLHVTYGIVEELLSRWEYSRDWKCPRNISSISVDLNPEIKEYKISILDRAIMRCIVKGASIRTTRNNRRKCFGSLMEAKLVGNEGFDLILIYSRTDILDEITVRFLRNLDSLLDLGNIFWRLEESLLSEMSLSAWDHLTCEKRTYPCIILLGRRYHMIGKEEFSIQICYILWQPISWKNISYESLWSDSLRIPTHCFPESLVFIRFVEKEDSFIWSEIHQENRSLDIHMRPREKIRIHTKWVVDITIAKRSRSRWEEEEVCHMSIQFLQKNTICARLFLDYLFLYEFQGKKKTSQILSRSFLRFFWYGEDYSLRSLRWTATRGTTRSHSRTEIRSHRTHTNILINISTYGRSK